MKKITSTKIESPNATYVVTAEKLSSIIQRSFDISGEDPSSFEKFADLFTRLLKYETHPPDPKPKKTVSEKDDTSAKLPFKSRIDRALFLLPTERYAYIPIKIAPSTIEGAGYGAFAMDTIPQGAKGVYKGVNRTYDASNQCYSWTVKTYDKKTGITDERDKVLHYIDACELDTSNWTRFVNCGRTERENNMLAEQSYSNFLYIAIHKIKKDTELRVDYGKKYREMNFGWDVSSSEDDLEGSSSEEESSEE
jgi:hypothetical protein